MDTPLTSPPNKKNFLKSGYPNYFRRDIHKLLLFGYNYVRPTINGDTEEPTITIRIAKAINEGLNKIGLLPDKLQRKPYSVAAETAEIEIVDVNNKKDKHIFFDIIFEESTKTVPRRRYIIEGKRLKKNDFAIGLYCDKGIMRFVKEIYAGDFPEAAMVGFWQDADAPYWYQELQRKYDENKLSNSMSVTKGLESSVVLSELPNEWVSIHARKSGREIILFHLFLECT